MACLAAKNVIFGNAVVAAIGRADDGISPGRRVV
jgi:hypothetical protein